MKTLKIKLFFFVLFCSISQVSANIQAKLRFPQYCTYHGYPTQTHHIHTDDGYNLQFFRLQAKNSTIQPKNKVVYLQHGLQDSSDTWVVNQQQYAPGFLLANAGYDVWLGNIRGNRYSSPILSPKIKNFWDFSFDEMILYDLPAAFKYISKFTGKKINYVGHSQGTLIMFGALSMHIPEVQQNLATYSALGPVAYLTNLQSNPLKKLAKSKITPALMKSNIMQIFYSKNQATYNFVSQLCAVDHGLCNFNLQAISEKNNTVNNLKRMPIVMGHFPSGSSTKNMNQFNQYIEKPVFCRYDYGQKQNIKIYGQKQPPVYDLKQISFPVHLFVGKYDRLANLKDADKLYKQLQNSQNKTKTQLEFGHATFIWGKSNIHVEKIKSIIENENL